MSRLQLLTTVSTAVAFTGLSLAWAPLAFAAEASAGDTSTGQVAEVIVTAQKRAERLQDVPLAVTAYGVQQLQAATVTNITNLDGMIPNVTLETVATFPNASAFSIRGLGFGDVEIDLRADRRRGGQRRLSVAQRRGDAGFVRHRPIEVRRGPQGTLDGGNTIGGVVALTTKKPTGRFDGEFEITGGDRGRLEVRAAVDAPLIKDVLSMRVSIMDLNYHGYLHNEADNATLGSINSLSERLTLLFTPSPNFDATLVVDHDHDHDGGFPNLNGTPPVGSTRSGAGLPAGRIRLPGKPEPEAV